MSLAVLGKSNVRGYYEIFCSQIISFCIGLYFQSYNSFSPVSIYCAYCLFIFVQFSCCPLRALNWSINWIELNWILYVKLKNDGCIPLLFSHEIWWDLCDFPESLDELSEMVLPLFNPVENKSVDIPYWSEGPYGPEHIKVCVCVHHIVQLLYWLLPVIKKHQQNSWLYFTL